MLVVVKKDGKVIATFMCFFSDRDELLLNIAKAVHSCYPADLDVVEWIKQERRRLADCGGAYGGLGFLAMWGKQGGRAFCRQCPDDHKAIGFAGGVSYQRV